MGRMRTNRRFWAVAATKTPNGRDAIANLTRQSFETYQPEYREPPVRGVRRTSSLFPGYIFVRVTLENFRPVISTRGVRHLFMCGERPSEVAKIEIEHLRSLENEKGYIEPSFASPPTFEVGQSVVAERGIFREKFGTFQGLAGSRSDRVRVLFEVLGKPYIHEISAYDVARVAA